MIPNTDVCEGYMSVKNKKYEPSVFCKGASVVNILLFLFNGVINSLKRPSTVQYVMC